MTLKLIRKDITEMKTEAIVNAANEMLQPGGGVCGAIFRKAGPDKLRQACNEIGFCATGNAVITPGFDLCKYIIHTVGPIYRGGHDNEEELLRSCYRNSLKLADENKIKSISFPIISSGIYGYPKDEAIRIAREEIQKYLENSEIEVYLVFYDLNSFLSSSVNFDDVEVYIQNNIIVPKAEMKTAGWRKEYEVFEDGDAFFSPNYIEADSRKLEDLIRNIDETFSQMLLRLIDEKGMTDVETYKRANIDRKLFSKIRSNKDYRPSKNTVLAFCIALKLSLDESIDLLEKAGYALSHSNKTDIIVEYFIRNEEYDIFELNETLFHFTAATL